jgi:thiol:disulfide interchange protein DsbC
MLTMLPLSIRQGAVAFALGALCTVPAALAQSPAAPAAPQATPIVTAETAGIKKLLDQKFPGSDVRFISKTNYFGLYEAMLDDKLIYTDPKVTYIFLGSIYDTATKTNVTEARQRKLNRIAMDKLPLDLAFKRVKGDGSRQLVIFSDADCPFCHRLEDEMKGLDNVTIYTFLFPIDQLHPDAARKSKQIWCSADKVKAWNDFFATGAVPDNKGDCGDPVAKTQALGNALKISATPTLVFADGTVVPGALPVEQIKAEMTSAEAEIKKLAAAPKS